MHSTPRPRWLRLLTGVVVTLTVLTAVVSVIAVVLDTRETEQTAAASAAQFTPQPFDTDFIEEPPSAAFLGDSYTTGVGASHRYKRWSTLVAKEMGWIELNYGLGGTNFATGGELKTGRPYTERLTDLKISNPDVVIVSSAGNTLKTDQMPGITKTFKEIREALPDARIVALSPFHGAGDYPDALADFGEDIKAGVEAVDGEYLDIGHPLRDHPELIVEDGIHPDDTGYAILADAVVDALR